MLKSSLLKDQSLLQKSSAKSSQLITKRRLWSEGRTVNVNIVNFGNTRRKLDFSNFVQQIV